MGRRPRRGHRATKAIDAKRLAPAGYGSDCYPADMALAELRDFQGEEDRIGLPVGLFEAAVALIEERSAGSPAPAIELA